MADEPNFYTNIPLPTLSVQAAPSSSEQQQGGGGGGGGGEGESQHQPSTAAQMRRLLISCAELVSQSNFLAAHNLISYLSSASSPYGDSTERLVHQFAKALSLRLNKAASASMMSSTSPSSSLSYAHRPPSFLSSALIPSAMSGLGLLGMEIVEEASVVHRQLQSSYICLNQVTPFIRFSHLTANQAILEAIEGQESIHILDFDTIMQGVQWPPLMQAIAASSNPPNMIRITGTGYDMESITRTGHRLANFAETLGLRFQFHPLLLNESTFVDLQLSSSITHFHDQALVVNCVLYLHRLLNRGEEAIRFLGKIKAMNPKVVTLAEREANLNNPVFTHRFSEALDHYTALFDSMEATLPPTNAERLAVEQVWLGREIADVVAAEGLERRQRYERFYTWGEMMRRSGFSNIPLSPFAVSQAKLLLRLHYPSEGYQLNILNDSLFLGWQNHALFSVSSWH